jgi:hypothetical protein
LFFEQPAFYWKGKTYSRGDAIKFLANKLGGAHYDFGRNKTESHIEEIQNQFGVIFDSPTKARMLTSDELRRLRGDGASRERVFDALQLIVGDTASIFCKGIRSYESQILSLIR